jgi:hypothetical protein
MITVNVAGTSDAIIRPPAAARRDLIFVAAGDDGRDPENAG